MLTLWTTVQPQSRVSAQESRGAPDQVLGPLPRNFSGPGGDKPSAAPSPGQVQACCHHEGPSIPTRSTSYHPPPPRRHTQMDSAMNNECSRTYREQDTESSSRHPVLQNFSFRTRYKEKGTRRSTDAPQALLRGHALALSTITTPHSPPSLFPFTAYFLYFFQSTSTCNILYSLLA